MRIDIFPASKTGIATWIFAVLGASFQWSCMSDPLKGGGPPEMSSCQSCHLSPPPTGEHSLHLYNQVYRAQIACDECHASAIRRMIWNTGLAVRGVARLSGWQRVARSGDRLILSDPALQAETWPLCSDDLLRGDSLFAALFDSTAAPEAVLDRRDSLAVSELWIERYPIDSWEVQVDTLDDPLFGPLIRERERRSYGVPLRYHRCEYGLRSDTLYRMALRGTGPLLTRLPPPDSGEVVRGDRQITVLRPDFTDSDTLEFRLIDASASPFSGFAAVEAYATRWEGAYYALSDAGGSWYRYAGDSLFSLGLDSTLSFGHGIFAATAAAHGNGLVDILFKHEPVTMFREETLEVVLNARGDTLSHILKRTGAWNPRRQSCWSDNLKAASCHTRISGEVFWYKPQ